jgi:hypothetical protein
MTPFEITTQYITPVPTMLYGLKYFPSLEPHCSNDQDSPNWGWHTPVEEVTDCNVAAVGSVMSRIANTCQAILEIGVSRNPGNTTTQVFLGKKSPSCVYLGVDLDDKSMLDNADLNIHTLRVSSHDKVAIRTRLKSLGVYQLDCIMIDGWHSVNTCVNDWGFVDLLSPSGVVLLHDTNAHPGCVALYNAVDEAMFTKERLCTGSDDHGISVFWHRAG